MVVWLWIGGALMALGTALALVPKSRRIVGPTSPAPTADSVPPATDAPDAVATVAP
jgi:hypothetical protein